MAQPLRAVATLPEDPNSVPDTCWGAHNCLKLQPEGIQHLLLASVGTYTHMAETKRPPHSILVFESNLIKVLPPIDLVWIMIS